MALRSVSAGLSGLGGVTSLCARSRGEPSSARCEQRLSDGSPLARANPCAPAPECGVTHFCLRTHTQRSEPCRDGGVGWGGWGPIWRAQGVCGPHPPQHATSARHGSPPHTSAQKRQRTMHKPARHYPSKPRSPGDSRKTRLVKMRMPGHSRFSPCSLMKARAAIVASFTALWAARSGSSRSFIRVPRRRSMWASGFCLNFRS